MLYNQGGLHGFHFGRMELPNFQNFATIADLCFDFSWLRKAHRVVSSGIAASPSVIIRLEFQPFSRWTLVFENFSLETLELKSQRVETAYKFLFTLKFYNSSHWRTLRLPKCDLYGCWETCSRPTCFSRNIDWEKGFYKRFGPKI